MSDNFDQHTPDLNKNKGPAANEPKAEETTYQAPQNPYHAPPVPQAPYGYPEQGYNPSHGQSGYQQYPQNGYPQQYPANIEGKKKVDLALILAIIGFFIAPLIFGIIALVLAKQGEDLGADAKTAKVVSWIDIGLGICGFLIFSLFFMIGFVDGFTSY